MRASSPRWRVTIRCTGSAKTKPTSSRRSLPMVSPRRPTGFDARALWRAALPILLACAADVFAAHPLISEDTGTQGAGKFELELGNAWTRDRGERAYEFGPQLSYGSLRELDVI